MTLSSLKELRQQWPSSFIFTNDGASFPTTRIAPLKGQPRTEPESKSKYNFRQKSGKNLADLANKPLPAKLKLLPERQQQVLALLKKHKKLSTKELANHLVPEVSERSVRGDLLALKKLKLVEMIGKGPNSLWKANNNP